jgi:acyl-CoA thioesterase-1
MQRPLGLRPLAVSAVLALGALACNDGGASEPRRNALSFDGPAAEVRDAPAPRSLAIPAEAPTVVFLSDSIGAGLHLPEHQAFPAVLQARLAARDLAFELVNASESGRTSAGGVTALDWVLRREPDVVVIAIGGNDGLRGIELADVERNLRTLIGRSREAGARVLLLGVRLPPNYGDYGTRFDALYPRLAEELDLAFVPFYMEGVGSVPEMNLPDGLHPTPEGHERLADNVQPVLEALLAEVAGG